MTKSTFPTRLARLLPAAFALPTSPSHASLITDKPSALSASDLSLLMLLFIVLAGGLLMPTMLKIAKAIGRILWAFLKVAAQVIWQEAVKWLLLAGAALFGLSQYFQ